MFDIKGMERRPLTWKLDVWIDTTFGWGHLGDREGRGRHICHQVRESSAQGKGREQRGDPAEGGRNQLKSTMENRGGTLRKAEPSGDSLAMQNISERSRKTNGVLAFISEQKADHSSLEQL